MNKVPYSPNNPQTTLIHGLHRKKQAICYKLRTQNQLLPWAILLGNGLCTPLAWWFRHSLAKGMAAQDPDELPGKILIIRADRIGDMILSLPFFKALKQNFPQSKVTCLASTISAQLLENNPYLDQVLTFDPPWFEGRAPWKGGTRTMQIIGLLKNQGFDLGIDLRGNQFNILLMALAQVKKRLSYDIVPGSFLLTHTCPYLAGKHESEYFLDLLQTVSRQRHKTPPGPYLFPAQENVRQAEKFLQQCSISSQDCLIVLHPGAGKGRTYKRWPPEYFIHLGKQLQQKFRAKIILTCSQSELELAKNIQAGIGKEVFISWERLKNLLDLAALLRQVQAVVATSTGIMHLAAAVGSFVVVLSGPENKKRWSPLGDNQIILRKDLPCSPCRETTCTSNGRCLRDIHPEEVLAILKSRLAKKSHPWYLANNFDSHPWSIQ